MKLDNSFIGRRAGGGYESTCRAARGAIQGSWGPLQAFWQGVCKRAAGRFQVVAQMPLFPSGAEFQPAIQKVNNRDVDFFQLPGFSDSSEKMFV